MSDPTLKTRREFLKVSLAGGALSWTLPGFVDATIGALTAAADGAEVQPVSGRDGPILVVVQLSGGNDGLNTVVPYTNDHYYRARPGLGLARSECLPLTDDFGLHPALGGVVELFDEGLLNIVLGVGYPNPNRSHFRSMEIWHTASEAEEVRRNGWLGRYFDNACSGEDPGVGIAIGDADPQIFRSEEGKAISFADPGDYRDFAMDEDEERNTPAGALYRSANRPMEAGAGGSIGDLRGAAPASGGGAPLKFLEKTALDAQVTSDRINRLSETGRNRVDYPNSRLARDLRTVGRLIGGGMPTQVYYVSMGGFDTHTNQSYAHEARLREWGDALRAFLGDMKAQGNLGRVQVLTFSEFGRRVAENANRGTDHGAAAPLFLAGGGIAPGFTGAYPSLAPEALYRGDLKHGIDFRQVYATLLERRLGVSHAPILGGRFELLDLVNAKQTGTAPAKPAGDQSRNST